MRPIRWLFPNAVWLVSNRCELEQFLLLPSARINALIGAWLGRAMEKFGDGIDLYGFIFLSNHFHLLLRDTKGQLAKFMWYFQTNLAKAINRELGRTSGRVFARRYDAELVDGDEEFLHLYAYVAGNAVKAGLVERALEWPGFSSLPAALSGNTMSFELLDRTAYHNATRSKKNVDKRKFIKTHSLNLATPPMWEGMTTREIRKQIVDLVSAFEYTHITARKSEGKTFPGPEFVLRQKPTDRPRDPAFAPRVYVLCRDKERRRELKSTWKTVTNSYRESHGKYQTASRLKRRVQVEWPEWTCPPCNSQPFGYARAA